MRKIWGSEMGSDSSWMSHYQEGCDERRSGPSAHPKDDCRTLGRALLPSEDGGVTLSLTPFPSPHRPCCHLSGIPPGFRQCPPPHHRYLPGCPATPSMGRGKVPPWAGPGEGLELGCWFLKQGESLHPGSEVQPGGGLLTSVLLSSQLVLGAAARVHRPQGGGSG